MKKINILGQKYEIIKSSDFEKYPDLQSFGGYCDYTIKQIVIRNYSNGICQSNDCEDQIVIENRVLRHELIHAFIYESGLWSNSDWATNEEMTDFFAIQYPKIKELFEKLDLGK